MPHHRALVVSVNALAQILHYYPQRNDASHNPRRKPPCSAHQAA